MSKKQRNKWCQQSAMIHMIHMIHVISLDISIPKSLAVGHHCKHCTYDSLFMCSTYKIEFYSAICININ